MIKLIKELKAGLSNLKNQRAAVKEVNTIKAANIKAEEDEQLNEEAKKLSEELNISLDVARSYLIALERSAVAELHKQKAKAKFKQMCKNAEEFTKKTEGKTKGKTDKSKNPYELPKFF